MTLMPTNEIQKLLKLQECDTEQLETELRLKRIPVEINNFQKKIKAEEEKLENGRKHCMEMEVRSNDMRNQRDSMEDQLAKYKIQQLQVKKNDEYQALTHEIESMCEKISAAEEVEITLLLEIDEERDRFAVSEEEIKKTIKLYEDQVVVLNEHEAKLKKEIGGIISAVEAAGNTVDPKYLKAYENVKRRFKKPPFVVPVIDKKVQGLLISNDVESKARKGEELVLCDNTGRIVYMP